MKEQIRNQLRELYQEFHDYDAKQPDRLNRWRHVEPESALLNSNGHYRWCRFIDCNKILIRF